MPKGREGHARVAVLAVIPEEMDAALDRFGATEEVGSGEEPHFTTAAALTRGTDALPFIVARCSDRSNEPASESAQLLMAHWRPEVIVLMGIAGGIQRIDTGAEGKAHLVGPKPGDLVAAQMIHFADYGKNVPKGFLPRFLPLAHPPSGLVHGHFERLRVSSNQDWAHELAALRPTPGIPTVHMGELLAVEAVAGNPYDRRQQQFIKYYDKALAVDMESKGVARAVQELDAAEGVHYHPRWLCIRGISDVVVGSKAALDLLGTDDNDAERQRWKVYASAVAALAAKLTVDRLVSRPRPYFPEQPSLPAWP